MKLFIFIATLILDQITKFVISISLQENQSLSILNGYLTLIRSHNSAALFGVLSEKSMLMLGMFIFTLSAIGIALMAYAIRYKKYQLPVGLVLILSGAVGNFIDRLIKGYVVDFIATPYFIFNLADLFIVLGVILLFLPSKSSD